VRENDNAARASSKKKRGARRTHVLIPEFVGTHEGTHGESGEARPRVSRKIHRKKHVRITNRFLPFPLYSFLYDQFVRCNAFSQLLHARATARTAPSESHTLAKVSNVGVAWARRRIVRALCGSVSHGSAKYFKPAARTRGETDMARTTMLPPDMMHDLRCPLGGLGRRDPPEDSSRARGRA